MSKLRNRITSAFEVLREFKIGHVTQVQGVVILKPDENGDLVVSEGAPNTSGSGTTGGTTSPAPAPSATPSDLPTVVYPPQILDLAGFSGVARLVVPDGANAASLHVAVGSITASLGTDLNYAPRLAVQDSVLLRGAQLAAFRLQAKTADTKVRIDYWKEGA